MKYYVYVSKNKIDMLFQQTAAATKATREATIGFDVKVLKGSIKEGSGVPVASQAQLRTILDELESHALVGEIHEEKPYIRGTLKMMWGGYGMDFGDDCPITFWGCSTDQIALGMAGSSYHLLGEQRNGRAHSHSLTYAIVEWFKQNLDEPFSRKKEDDPRLAEQARDQARGLADYDIANATYLAVSQMRGQETTFDFVAKVLHRSKWPDGFRTAGYQTIIIATPLYVSMED